MRHFSWDLHLHPGPSSAPRWGDGLQVWNAARDAGVRGFVWKSHEEHTIDRCRSLPPGPPVAIGSASLNPWATAATVRSALQAGARWIWGPTRNANGDLAWDLPLPSWWPELLPDLPAGVVLATGHVDAAGREAFAVIASQLSGVYCSVTHSLYLDDNEMIALADLGCAFEFDLYTAAYPVPGRPRRDLLERARELRDHDVFVYLTSDAGQAHVGNPFDFSGRMLDQLATEAGDRLIDELAVEKPEAFVARITVAGARS